MPDSYSIPSWLQPPSQAERERQQFIEDQAGVKAVSMLRKQIGFARMKDDANKAMQNGVDEATARKQALLNNADMIFEDHPEAIARILDGDEALKIRERALEQTKAWHEATIARDQKVLDEKIRQNDALNDVRGYSAETRRMVQEDRLKHDADETARKTSIGNRNADIRERALNETGAHHMATEDQQAAETTRRTLQGDRGLDIRQQTLNETGAHHVAQEDLGLGNLDLNLGKESRIADQNQQRINETGAHNVANEDLNLSREDRIGGQAASNEAGRNSRAKATRIVAAQKDPTILDLNQKITDLTADLSNPRHFWNSPLSVVRGKLTDLERLRARRLKEMGLTADDVETAAPAPAAAAAPAGNGKFDYDPKTGKLVPQK